MDDATSTSSAAAPAGAAAESTEASTTTESAAAPGVAAAAGGEAAPKVEEPQHTIKVGGKERKVGTAELVRLAQLNENAELTTKEARELEKRAKSILEAFEKDPRGAAARAMKEFGKKDLREVAIEMLQEEMQQVMEEERKKALDPTARELEELREKDKKRAEEDKTKAKKERETQIASVKKGIEQAVIQTLEEMPKAFRNDFVAQATIDAWEYVIDNAAELKKQGADLKKITPKSVAAEVMKQLRATAKEMADHPEEGATTEQPAAATAGDKKSDAHPALTSTPQVRNNEKNDDKKVEPRLTTSQLIRRATIGG